MEKMGAVLSYIESSSDRCMSLIGDTNIHSLSSSTARDMHKNTRHVSTLLSRELNQLVKVKS